MTIKDTCRQVCPCWWTQSASWDSLGSLNYSYIPFPGCSMLCLQSPAGDTLLPKTCFPWAIGSALSEAKRPPQSAWDFISVAPRVGVGVSSPPIILNSLIYFLHSIYHNLKLFFSLLFYLFYVSSTSNIGYTINICS